MKKVLVILGPTATGKSDIAVKLAKKFNGEVISADSRQIYTGLNIGTGKITKKEMLGIPHHMLDIVSPKKVFTVSEWKNKTEKIIEDILSRRKLPIICGGTGMYIQSIVDNVVYPEVGPNKKLREKLEKKSLEALTEMLRKMDPERAETIDTHNKVRLIRAIEIATELGRVPLPQFAVSQYEFLQIGLKLPDETLKKKIQTRLISRIQKGMLREAKNLHTQGVSWKRMRELGLEYGRMADFLEKKISKIDMVSQLETDIWRYAKRQMTWFKRDQRIQWHAPQFSAIQKTVKKFLTQ